jgi:hypothetical protein
MTNLEKSYAQSNTEAYVMGLEAASRAVKYLSTARGLLDWDKYHCLGMEVDYRPVLETSADRAAFDFGRASGYDQPIESIEIGAVTVVKTGIGFPPQEDYIQIYESEAQL